MEWILVIYIYAGTWAKGDSVAIQTVNGWKSESECTMAGNKLKPLVDQSSKELRFACLKRPQ